MKKNDFVKIRIPGERFWVRVINFDEKTFDGIIDNHLVNSVEHGLDFGDIVKDVPIADILDHLPAEEEKK